MMNEIRAMFILMFFLIGAVSLLNTYINQARHNALAAELVKISGEVNAVCSISTPMMEAMFP